VRIEKGDNSGKEFYEIWYELHATGDYFKRVISNLLNPVINTNVMVARNRDVE
jgi:hypothetical protein